MSQASIVAPAVNTVGSVSTVSVALNAAETRALLSEVPRVFHTEINDLLLTALAQSFAGWTGRRTLLVDLEGHGREELFADLDLSRTVGWFTTIFPVLLDLRGAASPIEELKRVKEQLRGIPRRGIGYGLLRYLSGDAQVRAQLEALPQAEVSFNYLGQLDQVLAKSELFAAARESGGAARDPRQRRRHLLEINASVAGGQLQAAWAYSTTAHRRETIEQLADGFVSALRGLIELSRTPGTHCYTPSDFPLINVTQGQLDALVEECATPQVEDIYPLSPVQQGMFFYCLSAPPGAYVEQINCGLEGYLDAAALERSWRSVVARHTILRTSFHLSELDEPLQVVHHASSLELKLAEHDLTRLTTEEQRDWVAEYLDADRQRGLRLDRAPLLRVALLRLGAQSYRFVWTFHHLLLDGWSVARIFKEVLTAYEQERGAVNISATQAPEPARPFRDYIAWLRRQDIGAAESFWRESLKGFRVPTPLGGDRAASAAPGYEDRQRTLSADATRRLQAFARGRQLTLNTLTQGAWALALGRLSRERDVLFGVTVSGRPPELSGAETMAGMFINTLPVRVRIGEGQTLAGWLKELQAGQVEMRQYEYTPLGLVQSWSDMTPGVGLFESLLVFENYPLAEAAQEQPDGRALRIEGVDTLTRTKYQLTLVVSPGAELGLYMAYDRQRFGGEIIERLLREVEVVLEAMCAGGAEQPVSALLARGDEEQAATLEGTDAAEPFADSLEEFTPPRNATEEKLASLWAEVMGLERIDVHRNFFDLGGHSLLATQVISRVRDAFPGRIALRSLFEHPTVALLAHHLDEVVGTGAHAEAPPLGRVNGERTRLPLSFAQQRLWILHQMDPRSVAFNIPVAVRLKGRLDADALRRTFDEVVRRHEVLRTTFVVEQGEPVQVVGAAGPHPLAFVDLSTLDDAEAHMRAQAQAEAARPFDLSSAPPFRTTLLRMSEEEHVVLLTMHHIASDGWSTNVLVREVSALYAAYASGAESPLAELPVQYGDYAVWQRGWLKGETLEGQLDYWRRELRDAATLRLPLDRERPAVQSNRGAAEEFELGADASRRLSELSRAEGCTTFMMVLAAFQTLLHRYSGQNDIVVGTDVANRTRAEVEPLIGFFVNQLVLRADFSDNPKFRRLLARTRQTVLAAYEHQDVPFEKVVEALRPERYKNTAPLFQVKLVFQNTARGVLELPSLSLEPVDVELGATQLDLILFMRESEEGLRGTLLYSTDLFDAPTIRRMLERFTALLEHFAADADVPVGFAEMRGAAERREQEASEKRREESKLEKLRSIKRTR